MERLSDTMKDLRLAAIAPAIVGHGVVFALFMSVAPASGPDHYEPEPIEIVLVDDLQLAFERRALSDPQIVLEPEQAGFSRNLDTRLGQAEGGVIDRAAIAEDAPFEAFAGVDRSETIVPQQVVAPQEAAQAGRLGEGGDRLAAIRLALRYQACQRLTEKRDPTCPAEDPLVAHLRVAALREAPNLQRVRVVSTAPSNYLENFVPEGERPYLARFEDAGFSATAENWRIAFEFDREAAFTANN